VAVIKHLDGDALAELAVAKDFGVHDQHSRVPTRLTTSLASAILRWPYPAIQTRPARAAAAAAAEREWRPSFRLMFATWRCTVWGLRNSRVAMSVSLSPSATSARTSRSRPLRSSIPVTSRG